MTLVLRAAARGDLRRILGFFERHGNSPSVSNRFFVSFHQTCDLLTKYPQMGQNEQAPGNSRYSQADVRRFPVRRFPNYSVYYRVTDSSVTVTRVLHGARDPELRTADPS